MTNKPTWEIEFDQKIKIEFGSTSPDDIKDFISTKLAEQRKEIIKKIEKVELENLEFAILSLDTIGGFTLAKERIINLIKQD